MRHVRTRKGVVFGLTVLMLLASQAPQAHAQRQQNPFPDRGDMPEFPRGMEWLNSRPLRISDLRGKFVLLDFWTYCCINCIHILPELKKLEKAYPNQLVVIGVHSAKFDTEKDSKNISEAILRYEIEHPVINDKDHQLWDSLGVNSWPTIILIDPEGKVVGSQPGEFRFEQLDAVLKKAVPYYRRQKTLDETPVHFELIANRTPADTPLRFPGKVLADEAGGRLFISDSNHNRIVVTTLDGKVLEIIGSGQIGSADGGYAKCEFDHPQGVALHNEILYVADTENHSIRKVDLRAKTVKTIAGTGKQAALGWGAVGVAKTTALNSPWALYVHQDDLYIAMAGAHQIWKMPLGGTKIGPYAGNGREDIVDGALLPRKPFDDSGYSSFAQPSGLTSDGEQLFVADSEGSSIRKVPFDPRGEVSTLVGTSKLPAGRLFAFGDVDGEQALSTFRLDGAGKVVVNDRGLPEIEGVRLQHALGVAYHDGRVYIADTYNNKIKVADAKTGAVRTLAGGGQPGNTDDPPLLDEPAGLSIANNALYIADTNNHAIRRLDLTSGEVSTLRFEGLEPPLAPEVRPSFAKADIRETPPLTLKPVDGVVRLQIQLPLPPGSKINDLAPMSYWATAEKPGPLRAEGLGRIPLATPSDAFEVRLPVEPGQTGETLVEVALDYYYCEEAGGLCKVGSILWKVPLKVDPSGKETAVLQ